MRYLDRGRASRQRQGSIQRHGSVGSSPRLTGLKMGPGVLPYPTGTRIGALSSVGRERLPYKQEVAGSNPAAPIEAPKVYCQKPMSATLFSRSTRAKIHARLDQLSPASIPHWGTMPAREMVCHVADHLRVALGDIEARPGGLAVRLGVGDRLPVESWGAHPWFGSVPGQEWGLLCWEHIDYHFRQFPGRRWRAAGGCEPLAYAGCGRLPTQFGITRTTRPSRSTTMIGPLRTSSPYPIFSTGSTISGATSAPGRRKGSASAAFTL